MSRIKKAQVSTFATLHVIFTLEKSMQKAANQIALCKGNKLPAPACAH